MVVTPTVSAFSFSLLPLVSGSVYMAGRYLVYGEILTPYFQVERCLVALVQFEGQVSRCALYIFTVFAYMILGKGDLSSWCCQLKRKKVSHGVLHVEELKVCAF